MGPGLATEEMVGRLASKDMMDFLESVERDFDHVIIDTPPALLMADAKLLAPVVDGVILVVGVGVSTLGMIQRCLREMEQVDANMLGLVLNGIRSTRGGYLRKNLELYYDYSESGARGNGHAAAQAQADADDQDAAIPAIVLMGDEDTAPQHDENA
jgi:Mrp family chromosome partitioning ATPase